MKRSIALLLCLLMLLFAFVGCSNEEKDEDLGAYIKMYLTDPVYNFDPAYAYDNESALRIVSLLYDNLFIINDDGKVEKSLVKSYKIDKKENTMLLKLRNDTSWSDGVAVTANDVVFAWQRILDSSKSFAAAVLLYDIKNARACKEGQVPSIDDVGVEALNESEIRITFEEDVDYDNFIRNLASYALVPLRSDILTRTTVEYDWAKSATAMVASGPFRLRTVSYEAEDAGIILERNAYYRRDFMKDKVDKSVRPYRLMIDYTMTDEDILNAYNNGEIFFIGDIPLSLRSKYTLEQWKKEMKAEVNDALSTHSYLFNENAIINNGGEGEKLFANKEVRNALSLAIDRTAIANTVVFAEAANGLVPNGVFDSTSKKDTFREKDSDGLVLSANLEAAQKKLTDAGIVASKYSFAISVSAYDDVHIKIAQEVQKAWSALGFKVTVNAIDVVDNKDTVVSTGAVISGVKDDIFMENLYAGKYEVAAIDYTALSVDAFSVLAPFAKGYTGSASVLPNSTDFNVAIHASGYNNTAYDDKIAAAYAEKDIKKRAVILHEAEELLMADMPIIPIVFNKSVTLKSKDLSKVDFSYYQTPILKDAKLRKYKDHIPEEENNK